MNHWHVYRVTIANPASPLGVIDFGLKFYRNRFESTEEAARGLATEVVNQYPAAKRIPSLRDVPVLMAANPHSAFRFTTDRGDLIVWSLLDCTGECQETFQRTGRTMRRQITARFNVPVIT